jgi:hypothetical protein
MIEEDRGTLRAVAWSELLPWLILFRCFRLSIGLRPLLLSSVAAVAMVFGWSLIGWFFSGNPEVASQHEAYNGCPWNTFAAVANDAGLVRGPVGFPEGTSAENANSIVHRDTNPILGTWEHLSRPFREVFTLNMGPDKEFRASKLTYSLLCALWTLAVWAIAGAAVTRDAAVQLASGERIGWGGMLGYAKSRWRAYTWAPLVPFLGVLIGAVIVAVFGLVFMKSDWLFWIAGVLWPLILAVGFLMTLLLLGLAFGWPLLFAAISTEGTDSFDALSRSYAYVFQRPLQLLFYVAVVTGIGLVGWVLVFGFTQTVIAMTQGAACWGSGGQFVFTADPVPHVVYQFAGGDSTSHLGWLGDLLIRTWSDCVRLLAVGYLYSYFWVSASAIYLLLRRDVDDTELDEVRLEEAESGETFGLPDIKKDEAGAPVVNSETPLSETE